MQAKMMTRKERWRTILALLLLVSGLHRLPILRRWLKRRVREVPQVEVEHLDEWIAEQKAEGEQVNATAQHWPIQLAFLFALRVLRPIFDRAEYKKWRSRTP